MFELPQRFQDKIQPEPNSGCWLWEGALTSHGYGSVWLNGCVHGAHRAVYEFYKGPIPADKELDHLCRIRSCCNPDHLEPVIHMVNSQRGDVGLYKKIQTHCKRGHEFTPENTRAEISNRSVVRRCRACARIIHRGTK